MIYSAGLGIPFILAAFAMRPFVNFLKRMKSRFGMVEKVMGGLLVPHRHRLPDRGYRDDGLLDAGNLPRPRAAWLNSIAQARPG